MEDAPHSAPEDDGGIEAASDADETSSPYVAPADEVAVAGEPAADDLSMTEWLQRMGSAPAPEEPEPADTEPAPTAEPEPDADASADQPGAASSDESLEDMVDQLREGEETVEGEGEADTEGEGEEASEQSETEEVPQDAGAPEEADEEAVGEEIAEGPLVRDRLGTKLPYWLYAGAWVVFVGVMTYLLWPLSNAPFVERQLYSYLVYGGIAMIVLGFAVLAGTWAWARSHSEGEERQGLARAMLLRASTAVFFGVLCWSAGLLVLDLHRIGRIG